MASERYLVAPEKIGVWPPNSPEVARDPAAAVLNPILPCRVEAKVEGGLGLVIEHQQMADHGIEIKDAMRVAFELEALHQPLVGLRRGIKTKERVKLAVGSNEKRWRVGNRVAKNIVNIGVYRL